MKRCQVWFLPTGKKTAFEISVFPSGEIWIRRGTFRVDAEGLVQWVKYKRWQGEKVSQ